MKKTVLEYKMILEKAVIAWNEEAKRVNPEPIGWVCVDSGGEKKFFYEKWGLCGIGSILFKRRNRNLATAVREFCKDRGLYCSFSDYHKARYCGFDKHMMEYDRISKFYSKVSLVLQENGITRDEFDTEVHYD